MPTFTVRIPGGRIGHFLAGAAVASVATGAAIAVTDTSFIYSNPQTGFYLVSPMDLTPSSDRVADNYSVSPKGLRYGETG